MMTRATLRPLPPDEHKREHRPGEHENYQRIVRTNRAEVRSKPRTVRTIRAWARPLPAGSEVFLEPVDDPLDPVDATVWPADRQHHVRLAGVADHLDLAAQRAQDRKHHFGLHGRTAKIVLGLQQEQRYLVAVDREVR